MSRRSRKRKIEVEEQKINDGEQDHFFSDEMREEIETMWEIPQIFQFLHLARESLNILQLSMYEMERMLLIPRASKQLANIMTCLLSSPITKAKLRKVPPMPYEFWTNILAYKMASWFKVYHAKHKDATKVLETIGVEPEFWNIFPDASLLDGKDFEDLSFKQRAWLLKTVCDTIMHTRKTVQEDITKQPWEDQFETVLGIDRYGARYVYFPQFIPNDLRIYRHCIDNKILSTVKPVKSKEEMEMRKIIGTRMRCRKRKSQSHNSLFDRKSSKHENRIIDKDLNNYKCNNDSATSSFISEDTNLSSTSTCSNNNNNSISFDAISMKRTRSLSKMSEESTLSNARSSGYDTTTSNDNRSVDEESSRMFKGFANTQDDNCNIGIINDMLDDLKSEIDEEKKVTKCDSSELVSGNIVGSYKSTTACNETLAVEKDDNERSNDNLSNSSKTDDEKLNDIISAESSKLPEGVYSKSVSISDSSPLTSKSDDEKLSETKTSGNVNINENSLNIKLTFNGSFCTSSSIDSASLSERVSTRERFNKVQVPPSITEAGSSDSIPERNLRKRTRLRSRYKTVENNQENKIEDIKKEIKEKELEKKETNEEHFSESETRLQEKMEDDPDSLYYTNTSDYNLLSKDPKTDECKRHFNQMLSDLSISDFHLVVDSVERLKDLIASFSTSDSESNNSNNVEITPLCEVKLIKKLTELLNSLEPMETILKDTMRKARAKLQREWSNFKEGVENQDSSSEGGLSSNWWVLGSQGRESLSAPGDATLQTLPQSALSPLGAQSIQQQTQSVEGEHENTAKSIEQSRCESQEASGEQQNGNGEKQSNVEAPPERNRIEEGKKQKHKQRKNESASNDEDTEQQTRRVLRARGVSSYTEQFYSDDESDENELEQWADVEAVYAAPGAQADTSASYATPKTRCSNDWSEEEDSDQDWILPGSRKRKNKRPSANRRLKSLQHKLQNIKENSSQGNSAPDVPPHPAKIGKDKLRIKVQDKKCQEPENSQVSGGDIVSPATTDNNSTGVAPSTPTICKVESVNCVHSELDIKDEGPVSYECGPPNHYSPQTSYGPQQNYYYVMPQHPGIAAGGMVHQGAPLIQQTGTIVQGTIAAPQIQQAYYVQSTAQSNYVMQNPQTNFLSAVQQQQQPVFQQQGPQMIATQPYISNTGYVPYVVTATQPQTEYMIAPRPIMNPQNPNYPIPRMQNRYNQNNRYATPRQNLQHFNGAVIRSNNPPVRGSCQRPVNPKFVRGNVPQQRMPNPKAVQRQKAPQTLSAETPNGQRTTSLIVLSDSDDEIEMIITEKTTTTAEKETTAKDRSASRKTVDQPKQKPTITSDITVASAKGVISPQIIQRMSQGGISITPVKNIPPPPTNANTQLVVVVNETGSHYALTLPNGSKLILTPEQVAQIRASNGGKLIL